MRPESCVAPGWWDYTTLDPVLLNDAARLSAGDLLGLARDGFAVKFYDTVEDFYLSEALEYITAWRQATADRPAGICGPIGPMLITLGELTSASTGPLASKAVNA